MGSILQRLDSHTSLLIVDQDVRVDVDEPTPISVRNGCWDGIYYKGEVFAGAYLESDGTFDESEWRGLGTFKVRVHRNIDVSGHYNDVYQRFKDTCTEHKIFGF